MDNTRGTVRVDGLTVSYVTAGQGQPVVLVHGLGAAKSWWRHTVPALAQQVQVFVPDLPAHGETDVPASVPDYGYGGRFLLAALDALGLRQAALVGHSLGGHIALDIAARAPDRVLRLVLVDSAGLGRELNWLLRAASIPGAGELLLGVLGQYRWEIRREFGALFHDPSVFTDDMAAEVLANRRRPRAGAVLLSMLRRGVNWRGLKTGALLLDRLPLVKAPTLIVWGDQDPLFPLSHAQRAHEAIRGSRIEVFPNCGHCPHLEYPEAFNRLVTSFLAEGSSPHALDVGRASP